MLDVENSSLCRIKILAWTGGVLDSDGSIVISKRKTRLSKGEHCLVVGVANTNPRMALFLEEQFGGHICVREPRGKRNNRNHWKLQLHWSIASKNAEAFLDEVYPYLVCKKKEAEVALQFRSTYNLRFLSRHRYRKGNDPSDYRGTPETVKKIRDELYERLKELHAKKW